MSRKIFVSYKHGDSDVRPIGSSGLIGIISSTTVRNYVDDLTRRLEEIHDHIYKGENDDESLAGFHDDTIASKLRTKIFDSTITLVLISKNMKNPAMSENDQWIPWEISYSLREKTREGRMSGMNAIVAVVIPDSNGSYDYFVKNICTNGCTSWQNDTTFGIIGKNMFNRKTPKTINCNYHAPGGAVHTGYDHSYIHPVKWDAFVSDIDGYINLATQINDNANDYEVIKSV